MQEEPTPARREQDALPGRGKKPHFPRTTKIVPETSRPSSPPWEPSQRRRDMEDHRGKLNRDRSRMLQLKTDLQHRDDALKQPQAKARGRPDNGTGRGRKSQGGIHSRQQERGKEWTDCDWDYSKLLLARVVLYALYCKKTENNFLMIKKFTFYPCYQGFEKLQKRIISQKLKIIVLGCLIAQMKRFDALIKTQKTPALCKVPFWKKSRKIA